MDVEVRWSSVKAWCLHAKQFIKKGQFISQYCGEVISTDEVGTDGRMDAWMGGWLDGCMKNPYIYPYVLLSMHVIRKKETKKGGKELLLLLIGMVVSF